MRAMGRLKDTLAQFCVDQREAFDAAAWLRKFEEQGEAVALVAKYLSMTSWYGHEAELERVCAAMHAFADNSNGLHRESRALSFDLHSFSVRVRLGLARARSAPTAAPSVASPPQRQSVRGEEA
jgi:hypothetical protein